jgi:undecaprenyl-diphosphatase
MEVTAGFFPFEKAFAMFSAAKQKGRNEMNQKKRKKLWQGILLLALFLAWTLLVQTVDVEVAGEAGTEIGFSALNRWFHRQTGVHWGLYHITDWLGLVPVAVCLGFGGLGLLQLWKGKDLRRVDGDILLLGLYYMAVIAEYLIFEMLPVNYRPVLVNGRLEASYPSSTTLLVLSVMPTLVFQGNRRLKSRRSKACLRVLVGLFSLFMVAGRTLSGVHWVTDIVGALLLSSGSFRIYEAFCLKIGRSTWNLAKNCSSSEKTEG